MSLPSFINSWTFYIIKLMIKKNDGQCHSLFTQIKFYWSIWHIIKTCFARKTNMIYWYIMIPIIQERRFIVIFSSSFYLYIYYEYLHKLASLLCFWNSFFIHTSWNQRLLHRTFEPLKKTGIYFFVRMLIKFVLEHICTLFLY